MKLKTVNFFVLESSSNLEKLKIIFTYNGLDCFLNFIYFFLGCTATVPVSRLSLVVASGLLIVAASPVAEHGPQGTWAQQFWHTGLAVSWHVDSSWTRDRTRVPCIGRWILTTGQPGKPCSIFYFFTLRFNQGLLIAFVSLPFTTCFHNYCSHF